MVHSQRLVAVTLDLDWGYKRHHEVLAGIQQYARQQRGWQCVLDPFAGDTISTRRRRQRYDGIIARATPRLAAQARRAGVPVVNVWLSSPEQMLPRVVPDVVAAGRMAAEHLITRGLKRFGYFGFRRVGSCVGELAGFSDSVARAGFTCSNHLVHQHCVRNSERWSRTIEGMAQWVGSWQLPIGVFGTDDVACRYLIDVCIRLGLRIPDDVAIVGCGNELVLCDEPEPTLSSIDMGAMRNGYRAAELLDRLMHGEQPPAEPIRIEPTELVTRRSTDVLVVGDPMVARAVQFIAQHGQKSIHVPDVVASLRVQRRSLERRFRAALGARSAKRFAACASSTPSG